MREYFDDAYEDFLDVWQPFVEFCQSLAEAVKDFTIRLALPLWIIPYVVYRKVTERRSSS